MAESTNDDSIESIVTERLDSIFGDDEEESAPPPPPQKASPFEALRNAAEGMKQGFNQETLGRLNEEVLSLSVSRGKEPLYRPLLKMMEILMDHLGTAKEGGRTKVIGTLFSVVECMESIEGSEEQTDAQRRKRVQQEIESFKAFRSAVQKERVVAPEKARPAGETPPPKEDHPAPSPQPAPTPVVPEAEGKEARPAAETPPPAVPPQAPSSAPAPPAVSEDIIRRIEESITDLRKEMTGGLDKLAARLDTIQSSPESRPAPHADLSEALSRIEQRIASIETLPESLKELRTVLLKAIATTNKTINEQGRAASNTEDLKAGVREEVDGLRQDIRAWMAEPAEEGREDRMSGETLARLEERMERLQEETVSLRHEIQALRSGLADLQSIPRTEETRVDDEKAAEPVTETVQEEEVPPEGDQVESPAPAGDEEELSFEETADERPNALAYFLFQAGEKNYAVEARHVVKAARIGGGSQEKGFEKRRPHHLGYDDRSVQLEKRA